ncbi:MAG: hypothetical protein EBU01_05690 [Crocinitomicaceae bacterium]|nr:hypothetical protein [Crocinitomicaceae bacterium]
MTKRTQMLLVSISLAIALVLLSIWRWNSSFSNGSGGFNSTNWNERYKIDSKNPNGLYLFFQLIKLKNPKQKIVVISNEYQYDSILKRSENATFLMIADTIGLTDDESTLLKKRLLKGSSLFLSASKFSSNLLDTFGFDGREKFAFEKKIKLNFESKSASFYSVFQQDTIYDEWTGIYKPSTSSEYQFDPLIRFQALTALLRIQLPKSVVILHTLPRTLVNYQSKNKNAFEYNNFLLNQLPKNQTIYYVEFARVKNEGESYDDAPTAENSLLTLVLENRVLLNAMMMVFFTALLFIIFRTRRRKTIVPIIPTQPNTTKAFAETVASIYLSKQYPLSILTIQKKNFFDTVLRYYYIDLYRSQDDFALQMLSEKTNYKIAELKHLIDCLKVEKEVSNDFVSKTAKLQHKFYKHCGIIVPEEEKWKPQFEVSRNIWFTFLVFVAGFILFSAGLNLLAKSNGAGVILWILGTFILIFGTIRLIRPHIAIHPKEIKYYSTFGFSKSIPFSDIQKIEIVDNSIDIYTNSKTIHFSKMDTMKIDIIQLKGFIHLNKLYDNR